MKKNLFKTLLPATLVAGAAMPLFGLASCQNPTGGEESEEEAAKHVHVDEAQLPDPEAEKDYSISFTLDDNYSLDTENSEIHFPTQSENETQIVRLEKCHIDSTSKTIIVPGELVPSSIKPTVKLVSQKQNKVADIKTYKQMISDFYYNNSSKNVYYLGTEHGDFYKGTPTSIGDKTGYQTGLIRLDVKNGDVKCHHDGSLHTAQTTRTIVWTNYVTKDPDQTGYWLMKPDDTSVSTSPYHAIPSLRNTILLPCFGEDFDQYFDLQSFINGLKFDAIKNCYSGYLLPPEDEPWYVKLSFYLSKDKTKISRFEYEECMEATNPQTGPGFYIGKFHFIDSGRTEEEIIIPEVQQSKYNNYFSNFGMSGNDYYCNGVGVTSGTGTNKIKADFSNYTNFNSANITYMLYDTTSEKPTHEKDEIFVDGKKLIKGQDWTIKQKQGGSYYVEIIGDKIPSNATVICYGFTEETGVNSITFTQTPPQ